MVGIFPGPADRSFPGIRVGCGGIVFPFPLPAERSAHLFVGVDVLLGEHHFVGTPGNVGIVLGVLFDRLIACTFGKSQLFKPP